MPTNPDTRYTAPSPFDNPTAAQSRFDFDDPDQLTGESMPTYGQLMDDLFGGDAADTAGQAGDTERTPDTEPKPYAAYLKTIDLRPLAKETNDIETVETLHAALSGVRDKTGDIANVISDVRRDRIFEASGISTLHTHEDILVRLGKSEVARQIEWEKVEDADFSLGDDEYGKVRHIRDGLQKAITDETDEAKATMLQEEGKALDSFLEWNDDAKEDELMGLHEKAATTYYSLAKEQYPAVGDDVFEASEAVLKLAYINEQEARALRFLSNHLDKLEGNANEETQQTALDVATQNLNEARTAYATIQASRQKKLFKRKNDEFIAAEEAYHSAVRGMISSEIDAKKNDGNAFDDETALNEYIATRTVDEAKALDEETIKEYGKTNGKLHKFINYIAGRKEDGEPDPGKMKMFVRLSVLGVAGAGLAAATVAFGGAPLAAVATGALTSGKLYANFEARGRYNRMRKTPGFVKKEDVMADLQSTEPRLTFDQDANELREMTPEEMALDKIDRSATRINKAANRETRNQRLHSVKRMVGAVAIGAGIGYGSHLLGHVLNGADAVQGQTPDTPPPPHGGGDITPPPATPDAPSIPMPSHEFAPGTFHAEAGEGYYSILKDMGVQASQRDDVLAKAANELFKNGYAYRMPDGLPGIPRTGELAQGAIDILVKAAGK